MKATGMLMSEHRLIERMIGIIKNKIPDLKASQTIDADFLDIIIDFLKTYADQVHHEKEEDILFRECTLKDMSEDDAEMIQKLTDEHIELRMVLSELQQARETFLKSRETIEPIIEKLNTLSELYPLHIDKEDRIFFPNSKKYFSEVEQERLLEEFREFDRTLIHEKYKLIIGDLLNS